MTDKKKRGVRCRNCTYCLEDPKAPGNGIATIIDVNRGREYYGEWVGMECRNKESPYYKALLNVSYGGDRLSDVVWKGCEFGERRALG
jgi:predicted nucleic-acid-binding Zn-ribbon protein